MKGRKSGSFGDLRHKKWLCSREIISDFLLLCIIKRKQYMLQKEIMTHKRNSLHNLRHTERDIYSFYMGF